MTHVLSGNRCVDTRKEYCYTEFIGGRCSNPLQVSVYRAICCCSSLGKAWGDGRCEPCPKKGRRRRGPTAEASRTLHLLHKVITSSAFQAPTHTAPCAYRTRAGLTRRGSGRTRAGPTAPARGATRAAGTSAPTGTWTWRTASATAPSGAGGPAAAASCPDRWRSTSAPPSPASAATAAARTCSAPSPASASPVTRR